MSTLVSRLILDEQADSRVPTSSRPVYNKMVRTVNIVRENQRPSNPPVDLRDCLDFEGRGLFAKRSFKKGDTILKEVPIVCSQFPWNELYKYRACEYCLRALETAEENARRLTQNEDLDLPHPECCETIKQDLVLCPHCQVEYCCAKCRDEAWSLYHQVLCTGQSRLDPQHPFNKLQETWKTMHYPPETSSIMLIMKMVAMVKQAKDKSKLIGRFSQFVNTAVSADELVVHKLLGEQFQVQLDVLRGQLSEALFDEDVHMWFTPEGFQKLFALIGTNGQGIGTSSISQWVHNCEELSDNKKAQLDEFIDQLYEDLNDVSGTFLDCEGSGLYELQSACNHSCVPNAEITFPHNNHNLELKALDMIQPDEEICISYLGECERERSRHSRQKHLRENYLFTCSCPKCIDQAEDLDATSDEEMDDDPTS